MTKNQEFIRDSVWSLVNFDFDGEIEITERENDVYVNYDGQKAILGGGSRSMLARAFFLFASEIKKGAKSISITQTPSFERCGIMADMSRNGVFSVEGVKRFITNLSALGYNYLMLYTEDTYEVKTEPLFGYMRGRYSLEELREIDDFGDSLGIEIVPCIQTLAHLGQFLKWPEILFRLADTPDILLIDNEETYKFIEDAVSGLAATLRSKRIHIGMDEAHNMGLGRYLNEHGLVNRFEIMNRHLSRVVDICRKYGLEPMMWSDMYFRLAAGGEYYAADSKIDQAVLDSLPDVDMVYWDYYHTEKSHYDSMIASHKRLGQRVIFGGGMNTWYGHLPDYKYTEQISTAALESCLENGITDVMSTMWGDDGNEQNIFMSVPQFPIYSEYNYRGKACTLDDIKKISEALTGIPYDDFADIGHAFHGEGNKQYLLKSLFYSDVFYDLGKPFPDDCDELIAELKLLEERCLFGEHRDNNFFRYAGLIYSILENKAVLRRDMRKAYKSGDKNTIEKLYDENLKPLKLLYAELANIHEEIKLADYKPFGFEVIQYRYGAIIRRLDYEIRVIGNYIEGKKDKIDELAESYVQFDNQAYLSHNSMTPSEIYF